MDDIDDLFSEQLNEGLNDGINDNLTNGLNGHLEHQLTVPLNEQLAISTVTPPPLGLAERLDELHLGGCNQSIAWSKLGALACIGADRKSVTIHCLQFHHDGTWKLSECQDPLLMERLTLFYKGYNFVHVAWSPNGNDLLVIDACGRIALGIVYIALNRVPVQKFHNCDPEDNLNAVVAVRWLNTNRRPTIVAGTATKENGRWKYPLAPMEAKGPFSPNQKTGFLIVTRGCMIKLYLQSTQHPEWFESKLELDGLSSSSETVTHAAMCSEKGHSKKDDEILLAVYTTARRLRLYSIRIDWQVNSETISASVHAQHIARLDRCLPSLEHSLLPGALGIPHEKPELCSLILLPRVAPPAIQEPAPPVILAAFSQNGLSGTTNAIISRWEIVESSASIDPTFSQLSTKKSSQGQLSDERILRQLEDTRLEYPVVNIELIHNETTIVLFYSSGEVEFRERSMAISQLEDKTDRATTLTRLGFGFPDLEPCLEACLTPHSTIKVSLNKARERKVSPLKLNLALPDAEIVSQVAAIFMLLHATSEALGSNPTDDLLMAMEEFQQQLTSDQRRSMITQFLKDTYQTLQITDKSADTTIESLIKFPQLGKAASVQAALGLEPVQTGRLHWNRVGKIGFTIQNFRIIALSLSFSISIAQKGQEIDLHKPDILDYITPQVKWMITLVDYILDSLFHVNRKMGTEEPFNVDLLATRSEASYACLVLVLCTITRNFLRHIIRTMIKALPSIIQQSMPTASPPLHAKYIALSNALRSGVVPPQQLDAILEATDQTLTTFYSRMRPALRQEIEMQLLAEGTIPAGLNPILQKIFSQIVEVVRVRTGELEEKLFFKRWGPVTLVHDKQTEDWEARTVWDGSRKVDITGKNVRKRVCLRCTGLMEDPGKEKVSNRGWMPNLMRSCFCGGHWIVEPSMDGS